MLTEQQKEQLSSQSPEYIELRAVISDYNKYVWLNKKHYCIKSYINEEYPEIKEEVYTYSADLAQRNSDFMERWPEKKAKIIARLKKDRYFARGGKISDKRTLKDGEVRFSELSDYVDLKQKFDTLYRMLAGGPVGRSRLLEDHIESLQARVKQLEDEFASKAKPSGLKRSATSPASEKVAAAQQMQ